MAEYNKLVRDRIPEIIHQNGGTGRFRQLSDGEYLAYLKAKLDEEVGEYHHDGNVEELADILEVVYALAEQQGISPAALEELRLKKRNARGGFEMHLLLIGTDSSE